jgi:cytochrome c peroxidase
VPDRAFELPLNETDFIVDRVAAVRLGKALFWDMQVGSDGVQSCGSCHFHAGADDRVKNQLNPARTPGTARCRCAARTRRSPPATSPSTS